MHYTRTIAASLFIISSLLSVTNAQVAQQETTTSQSVVEATFLTNNQQVAVGTMSRRGTKRYSIAVPSDAKNLRFKTTGTKGDVDIYVNKGTAPTTRNSTWKSDGFRSNENIYLRTPTAGTYNILLRAYSKAENVTLVVSYVEGTSSPVVMCEYAAPPSGCTYTQGPGYNSTTGCGMVLACTPVTPPVPTSTSTPVPPIACTMDARICPDGSSVGRSGPNCQFVCPVATTTTPTPVAPFISYMKSRAADAGVLYVGQATALYGTGLVGQLAVTIGTQTITTSGTEEFIVPVLPAGNVDITVRNAAGLVSNVYRALVVVPTTPAPVPTSATVRLDNRVQYNSQTDTSAAFISAGIASSTENTKVTSWKMQFTCPAGLAANIISSTATPGQNLCGSSTTYNSSSYANIALGGPFMSVGAVNSTNSSKVLVVTLTAYNSNSAIIATDIQEIPFGPVLSTPTVSISSSPAVVAQASNPTVVGSGSTLTWSSANATSCTASGAWSGAKAVSGTASVFLTTPSTYALTCIGTGGTATAQTSVSTTTSTPAPNTFSVTVSKVGQGTIITSPTGITCGTTCSATFQNGTNVSFTATPAAGYTFSKWSGLCYGITGCTSVSGATSLVATFVANPVVPVPTLSFQASPTTVTQGGQTTLSWTSTNATSCTATGVWSGTKATSGTVTVTPSTSASYTLMCEGAGGTVTSTVSIVSGTTPPSPTPTLSFTSSPATVTAGQPVTITWSSSNATSCTASGAWSGTKATSGTQSVTPTTASTYTLVCTGTGGSVTSTLTLGTPVATPTPTVSFNASQTSATQGQSIALTWSSTNATSCIATGAWTGTKATSGTQSVTPTTASTYTLVCTGTGGTATSVLTVDVSGSNMFTISVSKTGSGTITTTPSGITCGTTCSATFQNGTNVSFTATPAAGYTFSKWSGLCYGITGCTSVSGATSLVATFVATTPTPTPTPAPTVSLSSNPTSVTQGSASTLTWNSTNATSCTTSGAWSGTKATSGTQSVTPTTASTYSITCTGTGGTVTTSTTVAVTTVTTPAPSPTPAATPTTPASIPSASLGLTACTAGSGRDYQVGPNSGQLASLDQVPWENLQAGDTVRIFYKATPYTGKFLVTGNGTASAPIRICGVKGSNGERPIITGEGATTRTSLVYGGSYAGPIQQARGIIMIKAKDDNAWTQFPTNIQIDGLHIMKAHPNYTFKDTSGATKSYDKFGGCIWVDRGHDITIADNEINDCTNGIFSKSTDDGDFAVTKNLRIAGNYIYGNGIVGDEHEHNTYLQSVGIVYEFNRYGAPRAGAGGNGIKDRSVGAVIRFNRIEEGAHAIDLVEAQDYPHTAVANPAYRATYVYGNQIVKSGNSGSFIHYGGDMTGSTPNPDWGESVFRKGTLYFWNNTVNLLGGGNLFQLSTTDEKAEVWNNIFYSSGSVSMRQSSDVGAAWTPGGIVNLGRNWISSGWADSDQYHPVSGQLNGSTNVITGSTAPINLTTFVPTTPAVIDATQANLPAVSTTALNFQLTSQFVPQVRTVVGGGVDLGAVESGI